MPDDDLLDVGPQDPKPAPSDAQTLLRIDAAKSTPGGDAALQTLLSINPDAPASAPAKTPTAKISAESEERYRVVREHARGGMGRILVAKDEAVGREVALKELLKKAGGSASGDRSSAGNVEERFLREARITGQLEHPAIVPVYEIGRRPDGGLFYTMKFVRGRTMAERLSSIRKSQSPAPEKLAARLKLLEPFLMVCEAIAFSHSRGVIHRDLKPHNVMLGDYGETVVLDWGLARVKDAQEAEKAARPMPKLPETRYLTMSGVQSTPVIDGSGTSTATLDGSVIGTPAYMPPEQAQGQISQVDERSDVYSLGAMLYEIVTGVPPYEDPNPETIVNKVISGPPTPISTREPDAPPELVALVEHAMDRKREKRLASAQQLANELRAFREGRTLSVYRYTTVELLRRFINRHKAVSIITALAILLLASAAALHYVQITEQTERAEQARALAETQKKEAEDERARAMLLSESERNARQEAELQRESAEVAMADAKAQRVRAEAALAKAEESLADAYAMRARKALDDGRYNEALCFAAESLQHGEQPEARGILIATPAAHPLLQRLTPRSQQQPKFEEIYACAVSPDGRYLATGISEGAVWVWNSVTGEEVATLPARAGSAGALAFHPDGESLAVGYGDGTIRLWNLRTFTMVAQVLAHEDAGPAGARRVLSLDFSPDGRLLASGAMFGQVRVSKAADLAKVYHWQVDPGAWMQVVSWNRDGTRIAAASSDNVVRVLDASTGQILHRLTGHEAIAYGCDYAPDGSILASASWDTTVRLWDNDGNLLDTLRGHSSIVLSVQFSPDGRTLASGSADGTVALWDVATRKIISIIPGQGAWVHCVAFTPDSSGMVTRTADGTLRLWGLVPPNARTFVGHEREVFDVRFSPDGRRVATASWDGSAILWDPQTRKQVRKLTGHFGWVMSICFNDNGTEIATSGFDGTVRIYDAHSGRERKVLIGTMAQPLMHVEFSPDSLRVAATCADKTVRVWDRASGDALLVLTGADGPMAELHYSPDGKLIAAVGTDKLVHLWDANTGEKLAALAGHQGAMPTVRFSHDGTRIATGGVDREIRIWDVATRTCIKVLTGHTDAVHNVRFTRDDKRLYTGSGDKTVRLWDIESGRELLVLPGHDNAISRIAIAPDESMVVSASLDMSARVWPVHVLTEDPAKVRERVLLLTGLRIEGFGSFADTSWPPAGTHAEIEAVRGQYRQSQSDWQRRWEDMLEPWRCEEVPGTDGRLRRRHFPARKRNAQGNLEGPARGVVDYAGFRGSVLLRTVPALRAYEVYAGLAAEGAGLRVGDIITEVNGQAVASRDELRANTISGESSTWRVLRLKLDDKGNPLALRDNQGLILDEQGRPQWDAEVLTLTMPAGALGVRLEEARHEPHPWR